MFTLFGGHVIQPYLTVIIAILQQHKCKYWKLQLN